MEKSHTDGDKIPVESQQDSDILCDEVLNHLFEPATDLSFFDYETLQSNLAMPRETSPRINTPPMMSSVPCISSGTPVLSSGEVTANHEVSERGTTPARPSCERETLTNPKTLSRKERLEEERKTDFEIKFNKDLSWLDALIGDVHQSKRSPNCVLEAIDKFANERKEKVKIEETENKATKLNAESLTTQGRRRILNLISAKASSERLQSSEYAARQIVLMMFQKFIHEPAQTDLSSKRRRGDPDESQDSNRSPRMFSPDYSSSGSSKRGNNSSTVFGSGGQSSSGGTNTTYRSWSLSVPSISTESPCIDQTNPELVHELSIVSNSEVPESVTRGDTNNLAYTRPSHDTEPKEASEKNESYCSSCASNLDTDIASNNSGEVEPTLFRRKLAKGKLSKRLSDPVLIDSIPLLRLPPAIVTHETMN